LEIPLILEEKGFWKDVVKQLNNTSSLKKRIDNLISNLSRQSAEDKIELFMETLKTYSDMTVVVTFQDSFSGLRKSVRAKKGRFLKLTSHIQSGR